MDIGEAELAALEAIGQAFVIEAELLEQRGVQVVHVRSAFHHAGLTDGTKYDTDKLVDALVEDDYRDDIVSIQSALTRRYDRGL